ncbi:MAG: tRNA-intron lyase [Candidatus Asgardarchaeia archaeon]
MVEEKIRAEYVDGKILIKGNDGIQEVRGKSFLGTLEGNTLVLMPVEALLLMERDKIAVFKDGRELGFKELFYEVSKRDPEIWVNYVIYKDLKMRGYVVKRGVGSDILYCVYPRGADPERIPPHIYVSKIVEGEPAPLSKLREITKISESNRKKLILAVVDRVGDITYYEFEKVSL